MRKYFLSISILMSAMIAFTAIVRAGQIQYFMPTNINFSSLSKPTQKQIECLAENIYFEAGHESQKGKMAVALVTLNRLSSGNYGDDICGVVHQKTNGTCQFSWVCDKSFTDRRLTIKNTSLYNEVRNVATSVFLNYGNITDVTKGATYYHADYVNPGWKLPMTIKIGSHIFYKSYRDVQTMRKELSI